MISIFCDAGGYCAPPNFLRGPNGSQNEIVKKKNWGTFFNLQHFKGRRAC